MDSALNTAIVFLEGFLLLILISVYGLDDLLLDLRFMLKEHPRGVFIYLKYSWIIALILIVFLIILKWVFLFKSHFDEILTNFVIFLPLLLMAIYNSYKYRRQKVTYPLCLYKRIMFDFQKCNVLFKPILREGPQNEMYRQIRSSFAWTE